MQNIQYAGNHSLKVGYMNTVTEFNCSIAETQKLLRIRKL